MGATPEQQAVAALIDKAIKEAGLQRKEVAQLLGVDKSAVTKWCQARHAPDIGTMTRLAAITGKEVAYFYGERKTDPHQDLLELLMEVGRLVASGLSIPEAYVATGGSVSDMTDEMVKALQPLADDFRRIIAREAGRPWDSLSAEEQRLVLVRFADLLISPAPDVGRRGGSTGDIGSQTNRSVH